ncbi:unnamed protein product, partial [Symbiodinium microadriaticum]
ADFFSAARAHPAGAPSSYAGAVSDRVHAVPATSGEGDRQLVRYGSRLQGGAGGETELTDSGEGGARSARSGELPTCRRSGLKPKGKRAKG